MDCNHGSVPPLLRLPLELRHQVYAYLLPHTVQPTLKSSGSVVWRRGTTSLLCVCRQISSECLDRIYGMNDFSIVISYASIRWKYSWLLPSGLAPGRAYNFLEHFSPANIARIKHYIVNVEHVDNYLGMVKYNCGGRGLTDGLRVQVKRLVNVMVTAGELFEVKVRLTYGNNVLNELRKVTAHVVERDKKPEITQTVLEPLRKLHGVRRASISGPVMAEYAALVIADMVRPAENNAGTDIASSRPWLADEPPDILHALTPYAATPT